MVSRGVNPLWRNSGSLKNGPALMFDAFAVGLFIATTAMYFVRSRHENPPLTPYLVIACTCVAGNWLGENGGGIAAVALLIAASFLLLHLTSLPYRDEAVSEEAA